mgnify:FL=1
MKVSGIHSAPHTITVMKHLMVLTVSLLILNSCADKKESSSSCMVQLDENKFQAVAENTACSDSERASGYMGMAGLSFGNFLKSGASDNIPKTIGITTSLTSASDYTTGNRGYVTKALCLAGSDAILSSSRCTGQTKRNSLRDETSQELSMFGLIGDLLYMLYGMIDANLDGDLSSTETDNFTSLDTSGLSMSSIPLGINTVGFALPTYELLTSSGTSGTSYIADSTFKASPTTAKCEIYTDNYTVVPSTTTCSSSILSSITEVRPIYKLDNLSDLTAGGDLTSRVSLITELGTTSSYLDSEFSDMGISSTNSIRKSLTDSLSKIDNGATTSTDSTAGSCTAITVNPAAFFFQWIGSWLQGPADNSTSVSSTALKGKNLLYLGTNLSSDYQV